METLEASTHSFDTIVGQDLVKRFLLRAVERQRLPQALLFAGPPGVGKRSLMFALTKHLVCRHFEPGSPEAEKAAGKVSRGTHPDVLVIEPRSASGQILKEQVEELHERAWYAPLESTVRVIILHPVEAMNLYSANDLLKLLEEPPSALQLLLGAEQPQLSLDTIRSRCALVRCPPVAIEPLAQWLQENLRCSRQRAQAVARLSGGRPGVALRMFSGEDQEQRRQLCREMEFFKKQGFSGIFRVGHHLLQNTENPKEAMLLLLLWLRDLLVARLMANREDLPPPETACPLAEEDINLKMLINQDLLEELVQASGHYSAVGLARAIEECIQRLDSAAGPFVDSQLQMETLLTHMGMALKKAN